LDISKKYNKAAVASDLGLTIKSFDEFIIYLLKECELIRECDSGIITTDIVQENFDKVMGNREKARERKQRWVEKVLKGSGEKLKCSPEQNKKVKESKGKETIYTPNFISFWEEYPKKIGKGAAFKSYKNILDPKPTLKVILDIISLQIKSEQWQTKKYIPNPATWLNQRRWEDEITPVNNKLSKEEVLAKHGF